AKSLGPSTASVQVIRLVRPAFNSVQLCPSLVERKTFSPVEANKLPPTTTIERMYLSVGPVRPELTAVQLSPLSTLRKTPPKVVPAKRVVSLTAIVRTLRSVKPALICVQLCPLLVKR